ncbi:hypothetical protein TWF481_011707 [Arthrobotrys musiformis]|uniref:Uncharacterized protein n=1 Tax=Arthrobotrys musiformis TaxID=47236 RepID=A0AAV9VZ36_9PEZI
MAAQDQWQWQMGVPWEGGRSETGAPFGPSFKPITAKMSRGKHDDYEWSLTGVVRNPRFVVNQEGVSFRAAHADEEAHRALAADHGGHQTSTRRGLSPDFRYYVPEDGYRRPEPIPIRRPERRGHGHHSDDWGDPPTFTQPVYAPVPAPAPAPAPMPTPAPVAPMPTTGFFHGSQQQNAAIRPAYKVTIAGEHGESLAFIDKDGILYTTDRNGRFFGQTISSATSGFADQLLGARHIDSGVGAGRASAWSPQGQQNPVQSSGPTINGPLVNNTIVNHGTPYLLDSAPAVDSDAFTSPFAGQFTSYQPDFSQPVLNNTITNNPVYVKKPLKSLATAARPNHKSKPSTRSTKVSGSASKPSSGSRSCNRLTTKVVQKCPCGHSDDDPCCDGADCCSC